MVSLRRKVPTYADVYNTFSELMGCLIEQKVLWTGPPVALFHDMEYLTHDIDVEVALPVAGGFSPSGKITMGELPEIERAACFTYKGPYETSRSAYKTLIRWLTKNGYQLGAPNRELYIFGPVQSGDPKKYITELQFPITGY